VVKSEQLIDELPRLAAVRLGDTSDGTGREGAGCGVSLPDELLERVASAIAHRLHELTEDGKLVTPRYVGAEGAAEYLTIPLKRVYNKTAAKEMPHRKDGNRLMFDLRELDDWFESLDGVRLRASG